MLTQYTLLTKLTQLTKNLWDKITHFLWRTLRKGVLGSFLCSNQNQNLLT